MRFGSLVLSNGSMLEEPGSNPGGSLAASFILRGLNELYLMYK